MKRTVLLLCALGVAGCAAFAAGLAQPTHTFLEDHCFDCHDAETKKGGLDLTGLPFDAADAAAFEKWVRAFDRTREGEMPPKKKARPESGVLDGFLTQLAAGLTEADARRQREAGRVDARRLSRTEYENTMHELLGVDLPLQEFLPGDALRWLRGEGGRRFHIDPERIAVTGGSPPAHPRLAPGAPGQTSAALSLEMEMPLEQGTWIAVRCRAGLGQVAHTTPIYLRVKGGSFHNPKTAAQALARCEEALRELEAELAQPNTRADHNAWRSRAALAARIAKTRQILDALGTRHP